MKNTITGFVGAFVLAGLVFVGKVAYEDHKVVAQLKVLTTEVAKANGQSVTATDVVSALVEERLAQIKAAQAEAKAKASKP